MLKGPLFAETLSPIDINPERGGRVTSAPVIGENVLSGVVD